MKDEFDDFDDLDDAQGDFDTIVMTDDDGNDVEFSIIDACEYKGSKYLLVVETEVIDDEEADAALLKEVSTKNEEVVYEFVEDEKELQSVYEILKDNDDSYDLEY